MQGDRGKIDDEWPKPRFVKEVALQNTADVGRLGRPIAMTIGKVYYHYVAMEPSVLIDGTLAMEQQNWLRVAAADCGSGRWRCCEVL